ncbi:hypothetical protein MalM14_13600 [Gimesia chilikensis]|nr:hypothetical protein MalM14_13600 [Gimesia chilikensis]
MNQQSLASDHTCRAIVTVTYQPIKLLYLLLSNSPNLHHPLTKSSPNAHVISDRPSRATLFACTLRALICHHCLNRLNLIRTFRIVLLCNCASRARRMMRAPKHRAQVTQLHLNRRRFFQLFSRTFRTGSFYLVYFQIISEHIQSTFKQTRRNLRGIHRKHKAKSHLTSPRPSSKSSSARSTSLSHSRLTGLRLTADFIQWPPSLRDVPVALNSSAAGTLKI